MKTDAAAPELPVWEARDRVRAGKILSVQDRLTGFVLVVAASGGSAEIPVPPSFIAREDPRVGGYLLLGPEGEKSFAAQREFERMYDPIEDPNHEPDPDNHERHHLRAPEGAQRKDPPGRH